MQDTQTPTTPTETAPRSNRSAMMIVFLVVFIDLLGFGIILPLLPRIAETHVREIVPENDWRVGLIVGLLMSMFSLMQFLFAPLWGQLSDRLGRRPILLVGLFGSVIFYALFGYAASLETGLAVVLFFVARIGQGVAGATIATAQAVIADCTPPEKRKHGMALIGAAFGIGFTFGPLIGAGCLWLRNFNPELGIGIIGYVAAGLSFIAFLLGVWLLPETRAAAKEPAFDPSNIKEGTPPYRAAENPHVRRRWLNWAAGKEALTNPAIGPVVLTFFIASLGFGSFEVTLALFLKDNFDFGEDQSFLVFAYIGFVLMLTQGFFYRRLASRVSEVSFMAFGISCMGVGVALLAAIAFAVFTKQRGETWLYCALFMALTASVVGFACMTPSAQALISRRTPADRQGEILGVNQSASALARILGPILGVTLYKVHESHLAPYVIGAILLFAMLPMLPRIRRGG